ncbi:MAG TPA: CDP-glycerol glycerophosphotransferase family protein [Staphylococcus ureilyticus]|uniref:CDP-glycerol glycerophosphotransferase family protein n=1 Tax=Staphylococcus ureilyticus TaxID=94138 RepID=UPI001D7AE35E|nr:CDP-glycerol glycerophosphotransferase family protein [Staphylococcus ureilyticus]HJG68072.1 CDP-glycerol glycerophosphotransferase family protein [Staphylococcus ureilyticus]
MGLKKFFIKIRWDLFNFCFRWIPMNKNKIVVDNFFGKGYGGNPKYIVEKMFIENPNVDVIWVINNTVDKTLFPPQVKLVKFNSIRAIFEFSTAHIWIDNVKNNYKGRKRKGQFYIQTWHGGIGFKKVEKESIETLSKEYIKESKYDSKQIDLMISNSRWVSKNYRDNFWYNGKILETGLPRNDIFFMNSNNIKNKVKKFFRINGDIVLYAPTFRNYLSIDSQVELFKINGEKIVEELYKKFGKKYTLIVRAHPNIAKDFNLKENQFLKNGSDYPDMQELLVASDVLITDFSSSVFDFMLKSSRIFLFAKDYRDYIENEREMKINPQKDLPFSFATSEKKLLNDINNFNQKEMDRKVEMFNNKMGIKDDGKSSQRVANLLNKELKGSNV